MTDASHRLIENLERQNADCQAESEHPAHDIGGEVACYQCALNVAAMQRITELEAENARLRATHTKIVAAIDDQVKAGANHRLVLMIREALQT